ncbi:helix-turn-helix transcriptional regulator [Kordiimonas sp. SCSIO 12610]|uniref:ArsR/SmtB family transcription factor n=1 Tax=Kordiimonas sp. SCSIO 12610 TaxID=2829597 RepID=UPI00210C38EC|nr:metalloregulator ArsR/SmtB family transcription factor [Kordiimonas sp. SCSIO 12610]UTW56515.1 winged helix-turn-helix transcriptional regulator [Kordiimonas sp. SCSIO 12610]
MDTLDHIDLKAHLFQTLSNPARLKILKALENGPLNVSKISMATGLNEAKTSNLLKQLSYAGLLVCTKHGRKRYYSLFNPCLIDWVNGASSFITANMAQKPLITLAA